jgi:tetratricopeptide (TPR) repeat protein
MSGPWSASIVLFLALTGASPSQDSVDVVRQLYAAADYESALATLDRLATPAGAPEVTEVERYRALCLMALGRSADADAAIERVVRSDPSYEPGEQEPPRVRAAFAAVRARVLPEVARALYTEAKAAYDRKDYPGAVAAFERSVRILEAIESADPALRDLSTLASGFLDLSRAAIPPAPAAPAAATDAEVPTAEPASAETALPPAEPVAIEQALPPWNTVWLGSQAQMEFRGAIEVSIDEAGAVTSARIVQTIHPAYDPLLREAASKWRYVPARRDGKPVASTKRVEVVLRPR